MLGKGFVYFLIIVFVNTFSLYSEGQDSIYLFKELKEALTPQQKAKANMNLAKFFLQKNITKCLEYTSAAYKLSKSVDDEGVQADAICMEGEVNFLREDYERANLKYTESLSLYKKIKNNIGTAECYEGLGKVAYEKEEMDAALTHFSEALKLFEKEK